MRGIAKKANLLAGIESRPTTGAFQNDVLINKKVGFGNPTYRSLFNTTDIVILSEATAKRPLGGRISAC